jgi:hypothetical protein
VAKSAISKS